MEFEYLEVEDVELLHDLALKEYGGLPGREPGKLGLPMSGYGRYERFPGVTKKAAVYHYHLASGHAFGTSYLSAFTFLDWNGYDLIADEDIEQHIRKR